MFNIKSRIILMALLIGISFITAGCWDRKEIENRGYVLGVAVDHTSPTPKGQYDPNYTPQNVGERKYLVTVEMPKFRKSETSKEVSAGQSHLIWTGEGESMFTIMRMISAKTYFSPFFEDIQIIVFSESVAKEGIGDILDFFMRDAEMRRRMKVLVTPGRAEDILKAKLQVEEVNSLFISKLSRNDAKAPFFAGKPDLGEATMAIRANQSFIVPMVIVEDKNVRLMKGAVFNKETKMVGELTELEIIGEKILRKTLKEGVTVVANPANPQKVATFELYDRDIQVNSYLQDNQVNFSVEAKFIGTLGENMEHTQDALDPEFKSAVEQAVAKELSHQVMAAFTKQQQLKAEVSELGNLVHRQHPQYWKTVKDHWDDEVFPMATLNVNIKVIIRRPVITR